jgi:hypothetical protein
MFFSLLFHKNVIEKTFEKQIKDNIAVAPNKIKDITNKLPLKRPFDKLIHLISQTIVISSELNQFNGGIHAIAIDQIRKAIPRYEATLINHHNFV